MDWQKTAENMKKRGFTVRRYATGAEAAEALCEELKGQEIGMGGSVTAAQLGLPQVDDMMKRMGVTDEDLENLSDEMMNMMSLLVSEQFLVLHREKA